MKKALFTLLLVAATCCAAMAQDNGNRVIVSTDTTACQSFTWSANGQTYVADTVVTYINATNDTLFVLNLVVEQPAVVNDTVATDRCNYSWRGNTYSVNGDYADTVTTAAGCDSIYNLHLTVSDSEADTLVENVCGEYVWNGDTLTTTGFYSDTTTTATCMHIDVLNLSILTQLDRYDTVENCGRYMWHGDTLTQDGAYTHLFIDTVTLCDTLFHIDFHVVMNEMDIVYDSACNSRTWRNHTYTETGVYYDYDTNATTNCVTKRTLDLIIKPFRTPVKDTTMVGCNSVRFTVSSIRGSVTLVFTENADFDTSLSSINYALCYDSTIHLHAIVKYSTTSDTAAVACDSFYWDRTQRTYTASGEPKFTLPDTNAQGCDSIRVLTLTIKKSPVISAINGEWRLADGDTARFYPTCTSGATYRWTTTPNVPTTTDGDTLIVPNVTGNIDVTLEATVNYSDINFACHDTSWITIVTYVGIDGVNTPSVSLYPNPTVGQLNIECAEAISQVTIYNALGQQVALQNNMGSKSVMDLATLSRGTYTMRIVLANGETVIRKFVITK